MQQVQLRYTLLVQLYCGYRYTAASADHIRQVQLVQVTGGRYSRHWRQVRAVKVTGGRYSRHRRQVQPVQAIGTVGGNSCTVPAPARCVHHLAGGVGSGHRAAFLAAAGWRHGAHYCQDEGVIEREVRRQGNQQVQLLPLGLLHPRHVPGLRLWSVCLAELRRSHSAILEEPIGTVEKYRTPLRIRSQEGTEPSCAVCRPARRLVEVLLNKS